MPCLVCFTEIDASELLSCTLCKSNYHYRCNNMASAHYLANIYDLKRNWRCPACVNVNTNRRKGGATSGNQLDSPPAEVNMSCDEIVSEVCASKSNLDATPNPCAKDLHKTLATALPFTLEQFSTLLDKKLENMRCAITRDLKEEFGSALEKVKKEFAETTALLSSQLTETKQCLMTVTNKVEQLENENVKLKADVAVLKTSQLTASSNPDLEATIAQLQEEINDRDQAALINDVEITGIPELGSESIMHIILAVSAKLGVELTERDVVSAFRAGVKRRSNNDSSTRPRPRPIVVRLVRRTFRDAFIREARVRRHITSADLGLPAHDPCPVYVNERLTRANRSLFGKAREMGRTLDWRFIWTKEGRIYAKRTDSPTAPVHILKSQKDFLRVFGVEPSWVSK